MIKSQVGGKSEIEYTAAVEDDPQRRRPDISVARSVLGWEPRVELSEGLEKTIDYFRKELDRTEHRQRNRPHPNEYQVGSGQADNCQKPSDPSCKEL